MIMPLAMKGRAEMPDKQVLARMSKEEVERQG